MKKYEREKLILSEIRKRDSMTTKEYYIMTEKLGVVDITARRDLYRFEEFGYISIRSNLISIETPFFEAVREERKKINIDLKQIIGKKCNELISEEDVIYVSPGTTMESFVKSINKPLKILVTNGLGVHSAAINNPYIEKVILVGGVLRKQSKAFIGRDTINTIKKYSFDKGFFSTARVDQNFDIYNNEIDESTVFLTAMKSTKENHSFLLVDSTKFNKLGNGYVCNIRDFNNLVTDFNINTTIKQELDKVTNTIIAK